MALARRAMRWASVAQGLSMSGDIDIFWSESDPAGETIVELDVPIECAASCPEGEACDDGDPCTGDDVCTHEACVGTPLDCDDGNACTDDFCDPDTGCAHSDIVCSYGQICDPATGTCRDAEFGEPVFKFLPNDGFPHDHFGGSVGISGAIAIAGSPGDGDNGPRSGSAYLFDTATGEQNHPRHRA